MKKEAQLEKPPSPSPHAIEEYKETVAFMRHDDQIAWTILGLCSTLASGLWAYALKDLPLCSARAPAITLLGVCVLTIGRLLARRITALTRSRRRRAVELENALGFSLVTNLDSRLEKSVIGVNQLLTGVVALGWLAWFIVLMYYLKRGGC